MKKYQTFNTGLARFYTPVNIAGSGERPVEDITDPFLTLRYEARTIGTRRMAALADLGERADRLIRVPGAAGMNRINTQTVCVTEDGERYTVTRILGVMSVAPTSADIYLERMELPE